MRAKYVGNKADRIINIVKSGEATASIPRGTPLILNVTSVAGADDGLAVVLPSTAGNANSFGLRYGVGIQTMAPGEFGESIVFGVAPYALIVRGARTATSLSWASVASLSSVGVLLGVDTAANAFVIGASIAGSVESNGGQAILLDSLASMAGSASASTDTRLTLTQGARIFVRML